jgi:Adenylate and Guanylate cyclase catalytic domain
MSADVAVCGLPEPNDCHALVMSKFANSCRQQFNIAVLDLVTQLGPDTRDLRLRIGLHSGPVTAGVLRGQKSRFQLFGDTVNYASRMESTGSPNKIHASPETAKLLVDAGKGHWVRPRDSLVHAKGKGSIQTFWAEPSSRGSETATSEGSSQKKTTDTTALVDWTADILVSLTKQVIAHRPALISTPSMQEIEPTRETSTAIDEFKGAIETHRCAAEISNQLASSIELTKSVTTQIRQFVLAISLTYRGTWQFPGIRRAYKFPI